MAMLGKKQVLRVRNDSFFYHCRSVLVLIGRVAKLQVRHYAWICEHCNGVVGGIISTI
jgi:hypothetical protein